VIKHPRLYVLLKINTRTALVFTTYSGNAPKNPSEALPGFEGLLKGHSPRLILNIQEELEKGFLGQCNELLNFSNLETK
jgi:hypothetical protein